MKDFPMAKPALTSGGNKTVALTPDLKATSVETFDHLTSFKSAASIEFLKGKKYSTNTTI